MLQSVQLHSNWRNNILKNISRNVRTKNKIVRITKWIELQSGIFIKTTYLR